MADRVRDYKKEYQRDHSSTKAKKERASRNAARRQLEKEGRVSKGDGKDVGHKNSNPRDNSKGNLRVESRKANRGRKGPDGKNV